MEKSNKIELKTVSLLSAAAERIKSYRTVLLSALIWGCLAHMFQLTNKITNHDDIFSLFSLGATLSSGRWGLLLAGKLMPTISLPWFNGVCSLLFVAISVCVITKIFSIHNKLLQILLTGLIITFPSLTGTLTYMFISSVYMLAFLFSVSAVGVFISPRKYGMHWVIACLLCIVSLSIYQAYISVTASLLVIYLIQKLITEELGEASVFRIGVSGVFLLASALFLYLIILQFFIQSNQVSINAYSSEAIHFSPSFILQNIISAYSNFVNYFFKGSRGLVPSAFSRTVHIVCAGLLLAEITLQFLRIKRVAFRLLLLFLVCIFPFSMNCMYLIFRPENIHTLVLYSVSGIYILAAVIIQHGVSVSTGKLWLDKCRGFVFDLIVLSMAAVIVINAYAANAVYFRLYLRQENMYSFCTSVATHLQEIPGYNQNTNVVIAGQYPSPALFHNYFVDTQKIAGAQGITPDVYSIQSVFYHYLGLNIKIVDSTTKHAITETREFAEMPSYPANGYIQQIGSTVVIKLSNVY